MSAEPVDLGARAVAPEGVSRADEALDDPQPRPGSAAARHAGLLRWILIGSDTTALLAGWTIGLFVHPGPIVSPSLPSLLGAVTAAVAISLLAIATQRLFRSRDCAILTIETARLARAVVIGGLAALLLAAVLRIRDPYTAIAAGVSASLLLLMTFRGIYRGELADLRRRGMFTRPVVIVGSNDEGQELLDLLRDHPELGFRVVGVIGDPVMLAAHKFDVPWLGRIEDTPTAMAAAEANGAIIVTSAVPMARLNELVRTLALEGAHVHLSSGIWGIDHRRIRALPLAYEPLFYVEPMTLPRWQLAVKRGMDVALGVTFAILALPVMIAAALAVKLQDGGPVLFRQKRVGLNGKPFQLLKFRTMVPDAESRLAELRAANQRRGPLFKLAKDPRTTRVGRLLRVTSIDELPQLWNVLRGEMSLVGPRPALPEEAEQFSQRLRDRTRVRPGITGLWQVEARDNPSFAAYTRFDLFYVENWSVSLDIAILIATVRAVFSPSVGALLLTRARYEPVGVVRE